MPFRVQSHGASDVGLVRENNEDAWGCFCDNSLFIVADGLGGHQAGEVAAREAVDKFSTTYASLLQDNGDIELILKTCFEVTNKHLYDLSSTHELLRGMGTTICVLSLHGNKPHVAHVGDSRVYRFRDERLEQLTHDHCWTRAFFSPLQPGERSAKGVLTRAVGTNSFVQPTICPLDVLPKDVFLLCSDGLSDMVSAEEMEQVLSRRMTVGERVRSLLSLARTNGGGDNATVIVVEVLDDDSQGLSR